MSETNLVWKRWFLVLQPLQWLKSSRYSSGYSMPFGLPYILRLLWYQLATDWLDIIWNVILLEIKSYCIILLEKGNVKTLKDYFIFTRWSVKSRTWILPEKVLGGLISTLIHSVLCAFEILLISYGNLLL